MNSAKLLVCFKGNMNSSIIAKITAIFSKYRVNIFDINMFSTYENKCQLDITCQNSSTTDEIDSFWNDIDDATIDLNLSYHKKYIN